MKVEPEVINDLHTYCGGNPCLLQRMCYYLFEKGRLRKINDKDLVLDAQLRNFFESDYRHLTGNCKDLLLCFDWGVGLNSKIADQLKIRNREESLVELMKLGFIKYEKRDEKDNYFLSNIFLALWLEDQKDKRIDRESIRIKNFPKKIFISYAHHDTDSTLKNNLRKHLKVLELNGEISIWEDEQLAPGYKWEPEIERRLKQADVILFLLSSDLLSSKYVREKELPIALERHNREDIPVVPIILRKCLWQETDFAQFQLLPRNGHPIASMNEDDGLTEIALHLRDLVRSK